MRCGANIVSLLSSKASVELRPSATASSVEQIEGGASLKQGRPRPCCRLRVNEGGRCYGHLRSIPCSIRRIQIREGLTNKVAICFLLLEERNIDIAALIHYV